MPDNTTSKTILGIDPGTMIMGYGLIKTTNSKITVITLGTIKLHKLSDQYKKLQLIFKRILSIIDEYKPEVMAIEAPFYGKNVQSMLKLGRSQGVAMAAALYRSLEVYEYSPRKIKQAITGNGNASKEQVAGFLKSILNMPELHEDLDATDGLATAVCHNLQNNVINPNNNYKGWDDFIRENPDRINL